MNGLLTTPPPQPSPTGGGGSIFGGGGETLPSLCDFTLCADPRSVLSPPPLWGRVRVGGIRRWFHALPAVFVRGRQTQKENCGRGCAFGNWTAIGSDGSTPCAVMLSTLSACRKNSLLKLMAGSTLNRSKGTRSARSLLKKMDFGSFVSGTMKWCKISTGWLKLLERPWAKAVNAVTLCHPPTPALPHEGGGGYSAERDLGAVTHA